MLVLCSGVTFIKGKKHTGCKILFHSIFACNYPNYAPLIARAFEIYVYYITIGSLSNKLLANCSNMFKTWNQPYWTFTRLHLESLMIFPPVWLVRRFRIFKQKPKWALQFHQPYKNIVKMTIYRNSYEYMLLAYYISLQTHTLRIANKKHLNKKH